MIKNFFGTNIKTKEERSVFAKIFSVNFLFGPTFLVKF